MAQPPRLSVVVPFYGVQDYIGDCLASVRDQSFRDIEVLMVDDGSPDGSRAIAEEYAAQDSRFRLITRENGGLGPARNTGTEQAVGEYLTFVDSDDLIAQQAFERMVGCLDRTGSSFVLCNARRFSRTSGVRQSWTHQKICAKPRLGTHIYEFPELIRDRMVWNKVYRRSFWDEHGYEFPAIRYEDYPVTLPAHLAALTVDVLSLHGYYWRERESGDSITQQAFAYDNLLDRVVSAELVLDDVERHGTPSIRDALQRYLAEIDLVALAQAFAVVPDEDVDRLLTLGHRLADRLVSQVGNRPRFDQIQFAALRADDVPLLRELAQFRADGGLVGGVRATRRPLRPWRYDASFPGRGRSDAPLAAYTFPVTALTLRTTVTGLAFAGRTLQVDGTAEINHLETGADSGLTVNLVNGVDRHPLPVTRYRTLDQHASQSLVGFRADVDLDAIEASGPLLWPLRFEVEQRVGSMRRVGPLRTLRDGSPAYPPMLALRPGEWVAPGKARGDILAIRRELDPTTLVSVQRVGDRLRVEALVPERCRFATLRVDRPQSIGPVEVDGEVTDEGSASRVVAWLDPAAVTAGDTPDDPFTQRATRRLTLVTDAGDFPLLWPDYAVDVVAPAGDTPVTMTRSAYGAAVLVHGPALPIAERAALQDGAIKVSGRWWSSRRPDLITWRRYLPNSDDHVDVPADLTVDPGGAWAARADLADLVPPEGTVPLQPGGPAADWVLFAGAGDTADAVFATPSLAMGLPLVSAVQDRHLQVITHAATARVRVR
ncbi:glycosyltransferase [Flexivirga meconopsidis]|uniref:glycosyltransferase n=1 Tax=Flexivirga meconopsidis TaxID=2977121 RepID=UPI00224066FD|nr:glycosyltransferase [Flexivirga meconopsidis]